MNKISDKVYSGQSIGKLNHYLEVKDSIELIIYGSSRANHNIDPTKIHHNSFNMGVDGRMIAYCATLIKLLPEDKPQTILLHVDPKNAFDKDYTGRDILMLNSKYNRNSLIKKEIGNVNHNNVFQQFYWSLSYNGIVLGIMKNRLKPKYNYKKYDGYDPIKVSEVQKQIFTNKLRNRTPKDCKEDYNLNKLYNRYIDEIKQFCDENDKKLILFTSPTFMDDCKIDNDKFDQILNDKNITYYDLTDSFQKNNLTEYWKDETHLSDKGSKIFTEKMKKILDHDSNTKFNGTTVIMTR